MDRDLPVRGVAAGERVRGEHSKRRLPGQALQLFLSRESSIQENLRQRSVQVSREWPSISSHGQYKSLF